MWRRLRILILLLILGFVALDTYFDRVYSTDWNIPLRVAVYPINADGSELAEQFIRALNPDAFRPIEVFFAEQASHYGIELDPPVSMTLEAPLRELPPLLAPDTGVLGRIAWSLRARYWAWRIPEDRGVAPDIKLFALYHDPTRSPRLPHSLSMQKGLFGLAHLFADQRMLGSNDMVIAHEILHTLGATDKYAANTLLPQHPHGYADPEQQPLHPQRRAELMGGRIPVSPSDAEIPASLSEVVIGPQTAAEIGWHTR